MRRSLRLTLILSHLSLIVLAMGLAGVLLLTFLERYFLQAAEESLAAQARITAQTLIPGALTADPLEDVPSPLANTLQQRYASNLALQTDNLALPGTMTAGDLDLSYLANTSLQLGAQLETRIRILDLAGTVWVDSSESAGAAVSAVGDTTSEQERRLIAEALTGRYASRTLGVGRESQMAVVMPILVESELVGVAYLTQPLQDVNAVLNDLRSRWIWSTAIALLLSGIVGLVLSQAITHPLARLTTAAGAIAQGRFDDAELPRPGAGEIGHLSRAFNDMTGRLRAARQMQASFVANVSHELRTPLTAIKGMVETLRDGAADDVTVRDRFLETVETETDRLIRLVNDLLVLTRADAEALNLRREPLDVAELARATVERLIPQAERRGIALKIDKGPEPPLAWADGDRVAQVLVNLLDNAIKYSRPDGIVTARIATGPTADTVQIQVRDTGIGIPSGDLAQIGQRFYRADKARTRDRTRDRTHHGSQSGSGLGLSIAVALVEAHGGHLWIESEEGVGTTVSFTLPAA
jgi:signal transduction histidine kinase